MQKQLTGICTAGGGVLFSGSNPVPIFGGTSNILTVVSSACGTGCAFTLSLLVTTGRLVGFHK